MAVSGKMAKSNPQTVKGLVQILNQTKAWITGHPDEAQGIVAKELAIPIAVVQRAWPSHDWAATLDSNVIADIQAKADFLFERKYVDRRVDVGQVVDTSFN
jgi:ABC-type nitrate/sulfonate/bicarbonate transport system substrate-binding protein